VKSVCQSWFGAVTASADASPHRTIHAAYA
jgi:hypothetical protein